MRYHITATGCWKFGGNLTLKVGRKPGEKGRAFRLLNPRAVYETTHGPLPPEAKVTSSCGDPGCFNPAHMVLSSPEPDHASS